MRRFIAASILSSLATLPLAAQFEGSVLVKTQNAHEGGKAEYFIKGDKVAAKIFMPQGMGQYSGKEGRIIIDGSAMTVTMLMPMEMGGMKGIKQVTDLKAIAAKQNPVVVTEVGTSETIAGYKCDNIQVVDGKNKTVICMTSHLGHFAIQGQMGGRGGWTSVFVSHPGFPLRVTEPDGNVSFEVTEVKPGPVSAEMFVIPDGYMDMSGMMGGMGRGPGGP